MHSLHEKLAAARAQLVSAGIAPAEAAVDIPLFACTILGWDRVRLLTERSAAPPPALEPTFSQWVARRIAREPAAYIVGVREFWGLDFHVTPAVLIPRPETEFIVEEALELLNSFTIEAPKVADIGTGCGNIAVSLAHEVGGARVTATDVSRDALIIASGNAERYGVDDRIDFVETPYLDGIDDTFDLIAANPPYVKETDKAGLAADVLRLAAARPSLRLERVRADLQGIPRTAVIERV